MEKVGLCTSMLEVQHMMRTSFSRIGEDCYVGPGRQMWTPQSRLHMCARGFDGVAPINCVRRPRRFSTAVGDGKYSVEVERHQVQYILGDFPSARMLSNPIGSFHMALFGHGASLCVKSVPRWYLFVLCEDPRKRTSGLLNFR